MGKGDTSTNGKKRKGVILDELAKHEVSNEKAPMQELNYYVTRPPIRAPHMSSGANNDIINHLTNTLTPHQLSLFSATCFGVYLGLPSCAVQAQMARCFMIHELNQDNKEEFWIRVNKTILKFSIREFALITGLKCIGDINDFVFPKYSKNRPITTYFGDKSCVKKEELVECFEAKSWGSNDDDALKISLLYFIDTFMLSIQKDTTIPKLHFDLVESGKYDAFPWGKIAYKKLIKSYSQSMTFDKKLYRLCGMPLAMQVWFYECCSSVDPKVAVRVGHQSPRILNWKVTTTQIPYSDLMSGIFSNEGNTLVYQNILPTPKELDVHQFPCAKHVGIKDHIRSTVQEGFEYFNSTSSSIVSKRHNQETGASSATFTKKSNTNVYKSSKMNVTPPIKKQEPLQDFTPPVDKPNNVKPSYSTESSRSIPNEDSSLRRDFELFKQSVNNQFLALNTRMDNHFKILMEAIAGLSQSHSEKGLVSEVIPVFNHGGNDMEVVDELQDTNMSYVAPHNNNVSEDTIKSCTEEKKEGSKANTEAQYYCDAPKSDKVDDRKNSIQSVDVVHLDSTLPSQIQETRIGSTSQTKGVPIFDKKHPFELYNINRPLDMKLVKSYLNWLHGSYEPTLKEDLDIPFDFVICLVKRYDWFYKMSLSRFCWNDEHIDVIFYYLRKKSNNDRKSNYRYTTVDCVFKTKFEYIFEKYRKHNNDISVAKADDAICEYINGFRLLEILPWHTVDEVFIPVNCKECNHWVLAVLSFKYRRIRIYDSYRAAGHDASIKAEVDKLAILLPHYLSLCGFYDKYSLHWLYLDACVYGSDAIDVEFVDDLPQQDPQNMDCGVFVAAYAEYLSSEFEILSQGFNATYHRIRYGALLWKYGNDKNNGAICDNVAPSRFVRTIPDSEMHNIIVIE